MKKDFDTIMKSIRLDENGCQVMTETLNSPTFVFSADGYCVGVWISENGDAGVCGTDFESKNRISKYWDDCADYINSELSMLDHMGKINLVLTVLVSFIAECEGIDLAA